MDIGIELERFSSSIKKVYRDRIEYISREITTHESEELLIPPLTFQKYQ